MQRPDTPDGLFHAGNPATGVKGTPITAEWLNALLQIPVMFSGASEPPPADLGGNGDFYICTSTRNIYGPKTGGAWGSPWAQGIPGPPGPQGPEGPPGPAAATPWAGVRIVTEPVYLTYDYLHRVDTTEEFLAVHLPPALSNPGRQIYVENTGTMGNPVNVYASEGETVEGQNIVVLNDGNGAVFYSDGLNWWRLKTGSIAPFPPQ